MKIIVLLLATLAVARASVTVTQVSEDGSRHPIGMEIEVELPQVDKKKIRIPLTRTDDFEDIPMTVVDNGVSRTFSSKQAHDGSHAHYRDIASRSVISVREVEGKRQICGHVMHEGVSYFLEPMSGSHRVTKNVAKNAEAMAKQIDVSKLKMVSRRRRQSNKSPTTYVVELRLLLDDSVWSTMKSIFGDDSKTMTELHYYYTHILNGIDVAYRNIGSPAISVKCIGLTIAKRSSDSRWMPGSLEGKSILSSLESYIKNQPAADHFMAFTRKDITDRGSTSVCGMAYLNGACGPLRVSINEDQGLHCWGTAAHELGHNLGSRHDGDGNYCSGSSKNIMSPSTQIYSTSDVSNSYRFSSCTVSQINKYISGLGSSNCLTKTDGTQVSSVAQNVREGTRLTLDQVCKLAFPQTEGKHANSGSNTASICASIYCVKSPGRSSTIGGLRAPIGTTCGNRMSCNQDGKCTSDSQAPDVDMGCLSGDTAGSSTCQNYYNIISRASASTKTTYCNYVKSVCCKTLASVCP